MARVTIEDCKKNIPNPFNLVVIATYVALKRLYGSSLEESNSKEVKDEPIVEALRAIARNEVDIEGIEKSIRYRYACSENTHGTEEHSDSEQKKSSTPAPDISFSDFISEDIN